MNQNVKKYVEAIHILFQKEVVVSLISLCFQASQRSIPVCHTIPLQALFKYLLQITASLVRSNNESILPRWNEL